MYFLNDDIDIEDRIITYEEHCRINKLHKKIFLDITNMFNKVPNLLKRKLNDDAYKVSAPNFTTYLYKDEDELKMVFQYFNRPVKIDYGIPLVEVRAIMGLMNDFLRIQQRYNDLLILNKLCNIPDIRYEILKYLIPPKKARIFQLNRYLKKPNQDYNYLTNIYNKLSTLINQQIKQIQN